MFGQAMNPIIRADGNPKFAMISTLAGAVINIILPALCVPVLTETVPCPLLTPLVMPDAPVPIKVPPKIVQKAS